MNRMLAIENAKVVLENGILWDGVVLVEDGKIAAVGKVGQVQIPEGAERLDAKGAYVGPGFVDIHNHGGGGYLFDHDPAEAAAFFLKHGTTTVLPTLYYDLSKDAFLESIKRIKDVIQQGKAKNIGGIYMEAPYMNPKYGASPEKNKWRGPIRQEDYMPLLEEADDLARVWVVAPEREGLEPFMADAKAVNPKVVFSVGHSEATPAQVEALKHYGIRIMTHCMDATGRPETNGGTRSCGPDEACLMDSGMFAEIICDSQAIHVHADMLQMILKIKGVEKLILISDSFVSNEDSPQELRHITDLCFDANGGLCGSKLTLDVACRNAMTHSNCGIAQAFLMAATNPARAVGLDREVGSIAVGKKANLVFVDDMFHVKKVMLEGQFQPE